MFTDRHLGSASELETKHDGGISAETVDGVNVPRLEKRNGSQRWCLWGDAPFEELDKGELCRGVFERETAQGNLRKKHPEEGWVWAVLCERPETGQTSVWRR